MEPVWYTTSMKHAVSAGGIVVGPQGTIVLVEQKNNYWSLPKGHVNEGEDILEAAKREIYEETGIKLLNLVKPLGQYTRPGKTYGEGEEMVPALKTIHLFLFTTDQTDIKPIDPANPSAEWVRLNDVVSRLSSKQDQEYFESIKHEIINLASYGNNH